MEYTKENFKECFEEVTKKQNDVAKFSADMAIMIRDFCKQNKVSRAAILKEIDKWNDVFGFNYENYEFNFWEGEKINGKS